MITIKEICRSLFRVVGEDTHYDPEPVANPGRGVNFSRVAELLPYTGWIPDERLFILEGEKPDVVEALGFCLEMMPQTGAIPEMADLMATIFSYLPTNSSVQWTLTATPLIGDYIADFLATRVDPATVHDPSLRESAELYSELAKKQAEHYVAGTTKSLVVNAPYLLRNFRIVMSVTIPASSATDTELLREISSIRETCITTLKTYYQYRQEFGPEELIQWCAILLNPQATILNAELPPMGYDTGRPIRQQMIYPTTVTRVTESGLLYGLPQQKNEIVTHCMSVIRYPKACTLNAMGSMIGDYMQTALGYPCPFALSIGVIIQDFEGTRNKTQMAAARATQKADSPMARFMPELRDIKHDWDLAQHAFDDGKGVVKMLHQIVLFAKPHEVAKAEQAAQAVWRAKQFEITDDSYMQMQGLLATLPMSFTPSFQKDLKAAQRLSTKTAVNAVNMAPLLAEWAGFGDPVIPMWGRRGQAMAVDLFSNTSGNFNACVVGTSGSGKSALLNLMAMSYLGVGGRVWIIDIGRSFEKLCHSAGGQYLEFTSDANIRLNPFSLVNPDTFDDDMEMLVPLFALMISPSTPLDDYRKRQLGVHIQSVWYDYGREASIDALAYSLINNCEKGGPTPHATDEAYVTKIREMSYEERQSYCDPRIRDMGVCLFPYTQDGPYGKFFIGESNVNFEANFIVLEMEELSAKKDLQAVVMCLLMHKITQEMYLTRHQKKICIIDEAWSLLGGGSGDFIESGYRRARKYSGSFISGTQGVGDYFQSRAAEAALNNADWMFLLRQKPESILALEKADRMVMSESMKNMLLSVKTVQGSYAEVFVHAGQMGSGIGRILLDPFTLLLASSKAEDFEAVRFYRDRGMKTRDAIEAVLADRGVPGYQRVLLPKAA
jgi:conjugal transfer ATP-binding protein TraC